MGNRFGHCAISLILIWGVCLLSFVCSASYAAAQCDERDRSVLLRLKNMIGPSNENWEGPDCCEWDGIDCDDRDYRVTSLRIEMRPSHPLEPNNTVLLELCSLGRLEKVTMRSSMRRGLQGSISKCVCELETLTFLELFGHNFSGGIPDCITNLKMLQHLNLSSNSLTGSMPATLGALADLEILDISDNYLVEAIPSSMGNLESLKELNLSGNNLSGRIPRTLARQLEKLSILDLSHNNLTDDHALDDVLSRRFPNTSFVGNPGLCPALYTCKIQANKNNTTEAGDQANNNNTEADRGGLSTDNKIVLAVSVSGAFALLGLWFMYCTVRSTRRTAAAISSKLPNEHLRFTAQDLWIATEGYAKKNLLAINKWGCVYRGTLQDGQAVAIRKLNVKASKDYNVALLEVFETSMELRHRNILKVRGYCSTSDVKALVSEYIDNGNLDRHLHEDSRSSQFSWETRFNIALGIARALGYLHFDGGGDPVVHGGVKPTNIFIDDDLEPLLGDYGIMQFLLNQADYSSPVLELSKPYLAPELKRSEAATPKADVYSYGIVLLELLTSKRPTSEDVGEDLAGWVRSKLPDRSAEILDPSLLSTSLGFKKKMLRLLGLALMCTRDEPERRPSMEQVLEALIQIKHRSRSNSVEVSPLHVEECP